MKHKRNLLFALVLGAFAATGLQAADFKIVANPGVSATSISTEEVRGLFLVTQQSFKDGTKAEPVFEKSGPPHEAFLKYIGKSDAALQTYFRSLVFTGKGSMPKILPGDAEVVAYVAKTKGAIGYVSSGAVTSGVKTLEVK